jgi:hypothetical protein
VAGGYTVKEKRKIYAPKAKVNKENSVALEKFFHTSSELENAEELICGSLILVKQA